MPHQRVMVHILTKYDENDLFWANQNGQGEVAISQVQLLRSMLAKVGKGYSQSLRYDANY